MAKQAARIYPNPVHLTREWQNFISEGRPVFKNAITWTLRANRCSEISRRPGLSEAEALGVDYFNSNGDPPMESKPLGRTGVTIPEIGLGTSRYRGGIEPLRKGISLGGFIDTAEMYGTEDVVGSAVQGTRDSAFIASKVLPKNLKYSDLMQALERSLKLLQTDYIDLYQLHYPNPSVPIAESMRAMEELVDQGKIRFIGVSNFSKTELSEAMQAMTKYEIVSNQVQYSLTHRNIQGDLLPFCQQHHITVIAHTPLDRGGLVAKPILRRRQAVGVLQKVASQTGRTVAQVALNWGLSHANVVVIPKSNRTEGVIENCGASGWSLTLEQVGSLDEAFK